jgi:hypothetical protein
MKEIASSSRTKSNIELKEKHASDAQAFLDSAGVASNIVHYRRVQALEFGQATIGQEKQEEVKGRASAVGGFRIQKRGYGCRSLS